MNLAPGLIADVAGANIKVFLGTQPSLVVSKRLLPQMQSCYPWYSSRKSIKEQTNEFIELDAAALDVELFLRHCHIFFTRRQVYQDTLDKLTTLVEKGKLPKEAQPSTLTCLGQVMEQSRTRSAFEEKQLLFTKKMCSLELEPNAALDSWDIPAMMRVFAERQSPIEDAEAKAKAFLPAQTMMEAAEHLAKIVLPSEIQKGAPMEKKDLRLIGKHLLSTYDYKKIGCVDKMRPLDVTAYYRFFAERSVKPGQGPTGTFIPLLWGHVFRKFATHPEYLMQHSKYWLSEVDRKSGSPMPSDLALAVCAAQNALPATQLRLLNQYTNVEYSKHLWRKDWFVPLFRLFPLLGHGVAEDVMAGLMIDSAWSKLKLTPTSNPLDEQVVKEVQAAVSEAAALRESNPDLFYSKVIEAAAVAMPPALTEVEKAWLADFEAGRLDPKVTPVENDGTAESGEDYEIEYIYEEGIPELDPIPNEKLQ
jgi:hypothetical protein